QQPSPRSHLAWSFAGERLEAHRQSDEPATAERLVDRVAALTEAPRPGRRRTLRRDRERQRVRVPAGERRLLVEEVLDAERQAVPVVERVAPAEIDELIALVDAAVRIGHRRRRQALRVRAVLDRRPELMPKRQAPRPPEIAQRREDTIVVALALDLQRAAVGAGPIHRVQVRTILRLD